MDNFSRINCKIFQDMLYHLFFYMFIAILLQLASSLAFRFKYWSDSCCKVGQGTEMEMWWKIACFFYFKWKQSIGSAAGGRWAGLQKHLGAGVVCRTQNDGRFDGNESSVWGVWEKQWDRKNPPLVCLTLLNSYLSQCWASLH